MDRHTAWPQLLDGVDAQQRAEIERLTALAKQYHDTAENQKNDIERQAKEMERLKYLNGHLKLQAQNHAQEAGTANATIAKIYQCVSGSTGEHGNWHGAQPVQAEIERLQRDAENYKASYERCEEIIAGHEKEIDRLKAQLAKAKREVWEQITQIILTQYAEPRWTTLAQFAMYLVERCQEQKEQL